MRKLDGLIFDLDGTLVDSAGNLRDAINALLAQHERRPLTLEEVKRTTGDGLYATFQRAFSITGESLSEDRAQSLFRDFLELYQNTKASTDQLYPQAKETIVAYRTDGVKTGLCTNKLYSPTIKILRELGILELFDFVAGGDTFSVRKPHGDHLLGIARKLGLASEACVMIGDSANDILAAREARMTSVAVTHGYGGNAQDLNANAIIGGFAELPSVLNRLGFS